jgi:hypothetical protein
MTHVSELLPVAGPKLKNTARAGWWPPHYCYYYSVSVLFNLGFVFSSPARLADGGSGIAAAPQ